MSKYKEYWLEMIWRPFQNTRIDRYSVRWVTQCENEYKELKRTNDIVTAIKRAWKEHELMGSRECIIVWDVIEDKLVWSSLDIKENRNE